MANMAIAGNASDQVCHAASEITTEGKVAASEGAQQRDVIPNELRAPLDPSLTVPQPLSGHALIRYDAVLVRNLFVGHKQHVGASRRRQ
jgi:hypothetical protein